MKKFIFSFLALFCTIFVASADQAGVKFFAGADQIVSPSVDYSSNESPTLTPFAGLRSVGDVTLNMSSGLLTNGPTFQGAGSIVISVPVGRQITKIEIFPYNNADAVMAALSFSSGNATVNNASKITWEGSATEVKMTFAASLAGVDAPDGFNVYYGKGGSEEPNPDDPITPPAEDGTVLIQTAAVTMPSTPDLNLASCDVTKEGSVEVNGLGISWTADLFHIGIASYPNDLQYGYKTGTWTLTPPAGTEIVEVLVKCYDANYGKTVMDATSVNTGTMEVARISSGNDSFVWIGATSEPLVFTVNSAVNKDFDYITVVYQKIETPVTPPVGEDGSALIQTADVTMPSTPDLNLASCDVTKAASAEANGVGISWTADVFHVGLAAYPNDLQYGYVPGTWTLTPPAGTEIVEVLVNFYSANYGLTAMNGTSVNTGSMQAAKKVNSNDTFVWTGATSEPLVFTVNEKINLDFNYISVVYMATGSPVTPPGDKKIPAAVTGLAATVDNAARQVEVTFTLPDKYTDDSEIATDTEITATVVCGENSEVVTGAPAQTKTVTLAVADGTNKITVTTKVGEEENTEAAEISVYVGSVKPMPMTEVRVNATPDHKSVTLSWDVPEGVNGGYVNPAEVVYTIKYKSSRNPYMFNTLDHVKGVTEFTYTPNIADQDVYIFNVTPENGMGMATAVVAETAVMLGNAAALPMAQDFAEDQLVKSPYGDYYTGPKELFWGQLPIATYPGIGLGSTYFQFAKLSSKASAGWTNSGVDLDQYGYLVDSYGTSEGRIGSPFFSTVFNENKVVTLTASIYKQCTSVKIVALGGEMTEPIVVAEADKEGWNNISVELPEELMNKEYVQIFYDTEFNGSQSAHQYFALTSMAVDAATGVETVSAHAAGIFGGEGMLVVAGHAGEEVAIATLDGRVAACMMASDFETVSLAAGVYVVRTDNGVAKVVVK